MQYTGRRMQPLAYPGPRAQRQYDTHIISATTGGVNNPGFSECGASAPHSKWKGIAACPLKDRSVTQARCVEAGRDPLATGEDRLAVTQLIEAVEESIASGARVRLKR